MALVFYELVPGIIFITSLLFPLLIVLLIRHQRKNKRNPLTVQMLRTPGGSINQRIDKLDEEVDINYIFSCVIPLLVYSSYVTVKYVGKADVPPYIFILCGLVMLASIGRKLYRAVRQRHNECLGLDCERAVGQELNQLMLEGCRVYHDFQAGAFNIDHIIVGENGVFAIETKGRAKPDRGRGQEDVRVIYDGQILQFPTWQEKEPIDQAKRQAAWLSDWLTKAVGEKVIVKAGLVLPGWYVERKQPNFLVFNGKNPQFITKIKTETPLTPEMVQRVAHQLEQKCRDIEPQAYKKEPK